MSYHLRNQSPKTAVGNGIVMLLLRLSVPKGFPFELWNKNLGPIWIR